MFYHVKTGSSLCMVERILVVNNKRQRQRKKTNYFILFIINKRYIRTHYLNKII